MFRWQETFAQQTLQNGLDARAMNELQNKQMRLQRIEHITVCGTCLTTRAATSNTNPRPYQTTKLYVV